MTTQEQEDEVLRRRDTVAGAGVQVAMLRPAIDDPVRLAEIGTTRDSAVKMLADAEAIIGAEVPEKELHEKAAASAARRTGHFRRKHG